MTKQTTCSQRELLLALFVLTGFFAMFEVSYLIQCYRAYFYAFNLTTYKIKLPLAVLLDIAIFVTIQLVIHAVYAISIWFFTLLLCHAVPRLKAFLLPLGLSVWFLGVITALVANFIYYPNSKFSLLFQWLPEAAYGPLLVMLLAAWVCLALLAAIPLYRLFYRKPFVCGAITVFVGANLYLFSHPYFKQVNISDGASAAQPNIIIVGVDSLRPDFLSFFGSTRPTPFIDSFLKKATVFSDAVTPLARTYPSWMSILSGRYPKHTGARTNLSIPSTVDYRHSLPFALKEVGYHTMYATDETRFNNIDDRYGFETVVTPPIGVSDFLLDSANDFPLSNLMSNMWLGKLLFPYTYGNRPAFFNYYPESFIKSVAAQLPSERHSPLFLAIHFCLPHHPYIWADLDTRHTEPKEWYAASVLRVDQQLRSFFAILKQRKLLDHAIVILLSDHGETLEMPGDRITEEDLYLYSRKHPIMPHFYPPNEANEEVNQSGGHGTDVLGLPQYHSVLAFKLYGTQFQQVGIIPGVVSLLDIKPTLLSLVKLKHKMKLALRKSDGRSLVQNISGQRQQVPLRHLFLESGFSPESIRTTYPNMRDVILEGFNIFKINPQTNRLLVKSEMLNKIIKSKQFADIYGEWMLALYPQEGHSRVPILINLKTGMWTDDLDSAFATHSPAKQMRQNLERFFNDDLHLA